jgi:recombinational DNA repair protein RecR
MDTSFFLKSISDGMANFAGEIQKEIESVTKIGEEAKKKIESTTKEFKEKADKELKEVISKYASRLEKCEQSLVALEKSISDVSQETKNAESRLTTSIDSKQLESSKIYDERFNLLNISISDLQKKLIKIGEKAKIMGTQLTKLME